MQSSASIAPKQATEAMTIGPRKLRAWWTKWPDANFGLAFGRETRLFVLDTDSPKLRAETTEPPEEPREKETKLPADEPREHSEITRILQKTTGTCSKQSSRSFAVVALSVETK